MKKKCCEENSNSDLSQAVKFLQVVGEENRLKILCLLKEKELCVCDIWQNLNLSQNLVSHHLKILKDFGLVTSEQKGLNVFYSLNKEIIKNSTRLLNNYLD